MSVKVRRSWCVLSVIGSVVLAGTMLVQVVASRSKKAHPTAATRSAGALRDYLVGQVRP